MCLSKVYLKDKNSEIIIEEAASIIDNDGRIEINSIFGEKKEIEGFFIKETNLMENYIILGERKD
ncbi:MAG: CooT family nickel-binding protein [Spirochaetota bacterium]|nr:CooT family nickel-binding protein [Spirochaetota bacterium]